MPRVSLPSLRRRSQRALPRGNRRRLAMQTLDDRRVLAAIVGSVFHDANDSLKREDGEAALEHRIVFVDQNDNSQLDVNEQFALTDESGQFSIPGLADGQHVVRVFNGTDSQIQTTPSVITARPFLEEADITAMTPSMVLNPGTMDAEILPAIFVKGTSLHTLTDSGTIGSTMDVGVELQAIWRAPSGDLFALGSNASGHKAFVVDAALTSVTPFTDSDLAPAFIGGAVDDVGKGILLQEGVNGQSTVWSIDTVSMTAEATTTEVASETQLVGDSSARQTDGPTRSILSRATQVDDGQGGSTDALEIHVWSNASDSLLNNDPIIVDGGLEVVGFSDEAGLVVVRQANGLTVHDLESTDLATLYSLPSNAPVAIDAARGLIVTLTPDSVDAEAAGLRLIDAENGDLVVDLAIDLSTLNVPSASELANIALDPELKRVAILGAAGMAEMSLRTPAPHRVQITNNEDPNPIEFGMRLIGANTAPDYDTPPSWTMDEDTILNAAAPAIYGDASDAEEDEFLVIPRQGTNAGISTVTIAGSLAYVPNEDFAGNDEFTVWLHDGRDFTEHVLNITVNNVPDAPTEVIPHVNPVPENILINEIIGEIEVIDADFPSNHVIEIDDERFIVDQNGNLIFVGPEKLNWEDEWSIPLVITVHDEDFEEPLIHSATLQIEDADDPIEDVLPGTATVRENFEGDVVTEITVVDEDDDQFYEFAVDDERFMIISGSLRLRPGIAVDFEQSEEIVVNVTVSHQDDSFEKAITLQVIDMPEVPANFVLTPQTVEEQSPGAEVGLLSIAGNPAANNHRLSVNDSRFQFDGSTLRLANGVSVSLLDQEEIQLEITAESESSGVDPVTETFVIQVIENDTPYHNDIEPHDVNGDEEVTALDALTIINYLNTYGPGPVGFGDPGYGYDVNGDGFVTALDALLVINHLNTIDTPAGTVNNGEEEPGQGEGEPDAGGSLAEDETGSSDDVAPPLDSKGSASPRGFASSSSNSAARDQVLTDINKLIDSSSNDPYAVTTDDLVDVLTRVTGLAGDETDSALKLLSDETQD
ncbi:dockerin type I domain-containing protein [Rhodopirellula halodulae]|uniref:dockerin type I domain-containing protein n=1 Tax=Rhodopirellula halodulae TaxID=2894198 RepID=UPI001E5A8FEE|nr:dockerin type I domain-containing protein [Rhodopirellula sp. JC737]MCC9655655.1 dockerin type I domain-containing protein [Rhodopirellula sp. JC737]